MNKFCRNIVDNPIFLNSITVLILINAIVIGLETSQTLYVEYSVWFSIANQIILGVFIVEAIMKMLALTPRPQDYFKDTWNIFDFTIIVLSLLPLGSNLATLARLIRLFRVLRLISAFPELRLIVDTLLRSIPSMGHVALLMGIIFYIYGVAGFYLFKDIDPTHWETLGISLLTLFRIVTLEDWTDVMYAAMEHYTWAWLYFVSFVVVGTFVVVNLFIAVVLNNLDEAKMKRLEELQPIPGRDSMLKELKATQEALRKLQSQFEQYHFEPQVESKNNKIDAAAIGE